MDLKSFVVLFLFSCAAGALTVEAQDADCNGCQPKLNYTLALFAWTTRDNVSVEDVADDDGANGWPRVEGRFTIRAQTRDGECTVVGQSGDERVISDRISLVRVELPSDLTNVTALGVEYARGVNSTNGLEINVQTVRVKKLWPLRFALFTRRNETALLLPGQNNVFKKIFTSEDGSESFHNGNFPDQELGDEDSFDQM